VRGTALDVVERMGLLPRLRDAHVGLRRLTFLNGDGSELTSLPPHAVTGGDAGRDLEIPRGELTEALYATVRDRVEFVFDDRVDTLVETGHGVDVTFRSGTARTFDLVLGADGTHSRTREMLFGPEERFHHHLGHCFAVFTLPNTLALSHETVVWNTPGRAVALYAVGDSDEVHAFLDFVRPEPPRHAFGDRAAGQALLTEVFADAGWRVPEILTALHDADDVFLDAVCHIRMPRWTSHRAARVVERPGLSAGRRRLRVRVVHRPVRQPHPRRRLHARRLPRRPPGPHRGPRRLRTRHPPLRHPHPEPRRRGRRHPLPRHRRGPGPPQHPPALPAHPPLPTPQAGPLVPHPAGLPGALTPGPVRAGRAGVGRVPRGFGPFVRGPCGARPGARRGARGWGHAQST